MKDIVKFSGVLCLICLVAGAALAFIYDVAEPRITQQRKLAEQKAITEVLPQAPESIEKIQGNDLVFYKAKDASGNLIAHVIIAEAFGYSSDIKTVASLSPEGNIIAVKILDQRETPGVGSQIEEEKFLNQFKGRNFNQQFDTITGATVSSEAVINLIKEKAELLANYGK